MKELIGKKIVKVEIDSKQQHYLRFTTDTGEQLVYLADGDCCSESWFYSVSGLDCLLGQIVTAVEQINMGEIAEDGKSRQESDELYSVKLTTGRGVADVEFRNSSNGYYGGNVEFCDAENWRSVNIPNVKFAPITKDYIA